MFVCCVCCRLGAGTTRFCAGIVSVAKPLSIESKMADYSNALYERLEEETGVKTGEKPPSVHEPSLTWSSKTTFHMCSMFPGFVRTGSLCLAQNQDRFLSLKRLASRLKWADLLTSDLNDHPVVIYSDFTLKSIQNFLSQNINTEYDVLFLSGLLSFAGTLICVSHIQTCFVIVIDTQEPTAFGRRGDEWILLCLLGWLGMKKGCETRYKSSVRLSSDRFTRLRFSHVTTPVD